MTRRPLAALLATAALAAALPACGGGDDAAVVLGADDTGTTVEAKDGDTIRIELPANETTPYAWSVTQAPDATVAELADEGYDPDDNPDGEDGVGGTQAYELRVTGTGETTFAAQYARTAGADPDPQAFALTIRVG